YRCKQKSQNPTGNHLSDSYREHQERDWKRYAISISQYKRNNQYIGNDRRHRSQEAAFLSNQISKYRSDQSRDTSENNVRKKCASKKITQKASDKQARNCRRSKNRKNCQSFRNTDLNLPKTNRGKKKCQYDIDSPDHRGLDHK